MLCKLSAKSVTDMVRKRLILQRPSPIRVGTLLKVYLFDVFLSVPWYFSNVPQPSPWTTITNTFHHGSLYTPLLCIAPALCLGVKCFFPQRGPTPVVIKRVTSAQKVECFRAPETMSLGIRNYMGDTLCEKGYCTMWITENTSLQTNSVTHVQETVRYRQRNNFMWNSSDARHRVIRHSERVVVQKL